MRRALLVAVTLLGALAVPAGAASNGRGPCADREPARAFAVGTDAGWVAYPERRPQAIVVFFHGIGHTAADWATNHLERVATQEGVVAVAMEYPGTDATRTWQVQEGADASVRAARALLARCGDVPVVAYGVSMGANAAGLAVADAPGLFDWWIAVEGVHDVTETYLEARAVDQAVGNATARSAIAGIEAEMGGSIDQVPGSYARHSNVARAADIAAAGLRGVILVHGVGDGLVPFNQSREMATLLEGTGGHAVDFTTVLTRQDPSSTDDGTAGTTIDEYARTGQPSPFAGHANENSVEHLVGATGFRRLHELLHGCVAWTEHVVDGATGADVPPGADEVACSL